MTLTIGSSEDRVTIEPTRGGHRNCVPGVPRHFTKRRLGTQRRATRGVAASRPCLEEEQPRSPREPWPSRVAVHRLGSVQSPPVDLGARVLRVRPDQNKRTRLPGGRQQVWYVGRLSVSVPAPGRLWEKKPPDYGWCSYPSSRLSKGYSKISLCRTGSHPASKSQSYSSSLSLSSSDFSCSTSALYFSASSLYWGVSSVSIVDGNPSSFLLK